MTNYPNTITTDCAAFRRKPIAEFIDGNHYFEIPSYQRGYRWEEKQVRDLLDDISQFARDGRTDNAYYYLQPLVVKAKRLTVTGSDGAPAEVDGWEVLDGQQRLTTLLLILNHLRSEMRPSEMRDFAEKYYSIRYAIRPQLDFDNPRPSSNIDSYYLAQAKRTIEQWFRDNAPLCPTNIYDVFIDSLCRPKAAKQVVLIWYVLAPDGEEIESIQAFNRLNKGKIGLTSSELIKALFLMDYKLRHQGDDGGEWGAYSLGSKQLTMEWNEMERRFQDDRFWYFISNDSAEMQTRIDILFDFLTRRKPGDSTDADFSYRKFQNLFDHIHGSGVTLDPLWMELGIDSFDKAWKKIVETYNRMLQWYDNEESYHYIGFLVYCNETPLAIHGAIEDAKAQALAKDPDFDWGAADTTRQFHRMIMDKFRTGNNGEPMTKEGIDDLEYADRERVRRLLLLFNIESYRRHRNQRFDFRLFKTEQWDIEHIDSQDTASVQDIDDQVRWIRHVMDVLVREAKLKEDEYVASLIGHCRRLLADHAEHGYFKGRGRRSFQTLYERVNKYFAFDPLFDNSVDEVDLKLKEKDNITNLTLLDSATNREYHADPFPCKRDCIVGYDRDGERFITMCTRNVFLKYYTDTSQSGSYLDGMRWTRADRRGYLEAIHRMVDHIFESITAPQPAIETPQADDHTQL